jgi:hypothetical protein
MEPAIGANFLSAVETGSLSMCHQPGSGPHVVGQGFARGERWNLEVIAESAMASTQ